MTSSEPAQRIGRGGLEMADREANAARAITRPSCVARLGANGHRKSHSSVAGAYEFIGEGFYTGITYSVAIATGPFVVRSVGNARNARESQVYRDKFLASIRDRLDTAA